MSRRRAHPGQYDFFPERVVVEALDPRLVAGAATRVEALFRVKYEREPGVHQVFFDQYGRYCAEHGPDCRAVHEAASRRDVAAT